MAVIIRHVVLQKPISAQTWFFCSLKYKRCSEKVMDEIETFMLVGANGHDRVTENFKSSEQ